MPRTRKHIAIWVLVLIGVVVVVALVQCNLGGGGGGGGDSGGGPSPPPAPAPVSAGPLTGMFTGTYAWVCGNTGSSPITIHLTHVGTQMSGTAGYLSDVTAFSGTAQSDNGHVWLEITGSSTIRYNVFSGTVSGDSISGTTLSGEGCSAPTGPSGTFTLSRVPASTAVPIKLHLVGPSIGYMGRQSLSYAVRLLDGNDNPVFSSTDATVSLSSNSAHVVFTPVAITIPHGGNSRSFKLTDSAPEDISITASDANSALGSATLLATILPVGGTIGFDLDGSTVDHSKSARAVYVVGANITIISGVDSSGNGVSLYYPSSSNGTACGSIYYQNASHAQWGAGEGIGGTCAITVTTFGAVGSQIVGTFSATLVPQFGGATGNRTISNGQFAVYREKDN